jgi:zinc finger SWIM domain-containing protein 3
MGFSVRRRYTNRGTIDGVVTGCKFVCFKEGKKAADKRDSLTKKRAEIRTGCTVHISITLDREDGCYEIFDLDVEHNHMLQLPEACRLLPSQRKISEIQAFEIEIADDSGIAPKNAHEFASRVVGGLGNLSYTRRDHKNHLRTKRQRELKYDEADIILKYFQDKAIENPSFQHVVQLDRDEQIANVFWADAKMIIDYAHFGDVITFDTTFGTNKEYMPFGVFVGYHFIETTFYSFKWLFQAFLSVHNQKQPRTIFTDQDSAMGKAVERVFLESKHGLCNFPHYAECHQAST